MLNNSVESLLNTCRPLHPHINVKQQNKAVFGAAFSLSGLQNGSWFLGVGTLPWIWDWNWAKSDIKYSSGKGIDLAHFGYHFGLKICVMPRDKLSLSVLTVAFSWETNVSEQKELLGRFLIFLAMFLWLQWDVCCNCLTWWVMSRPQSLILTPLCQPW